MATVPALALLIFGPDAVSMTQQRRSATRETLHEHFAFAETAAISKLPPIFGLPAVQPMPLEILHENIFTSEVPALKGVSCRPILSALSDLLTYLGWFSPI